MAIGNLKIQQPQQEKSEDQNKDQNAENVGHQIARAAAYVHRTIGAGLEKRVYKQCLIEELKHARLNIETDVAVSIPFREMTVNPAFYIDVLVEGSAMIFINADPRSEKDAVQLRTYIRQSQKPEAFMVNFSVEDFKDAITHARVKTGNVLAEKQAANSVN